MKKTAVCGIDMRDRETFNLLYETYFFALKYFGLKYLCDQGQVCDIIQEVFFKLWKTGQKFESEIALRAFLYNSIRNSCLNEIRDTKIHNRIHEEMENYDTEESFFANIIEAEIFETVRCGFAQLPESVKRVYKMSLEGMSHAEISEILKISINTVKKHKNTANHFLRKKLKDIYLIILTLSWC